MNGDLDKRRLASKNLQQALDRFNEGCDGIGFVTCGFVLIQLTHCKVLRIILQVIEWALREQRLNASVVGRDELAVRIDKNGFAQGDQRIRDSSLKKSLPESGDPSTRSVQAGRYLQSRRRCTRLSALRS